MKDLPHNILKFRGGIPPRCVRSGHVAGGKFAFGEFPASD